MLSLEKRVKKLKIKRMHCISCAVVITETLRSLRGVSRVLIDFVNNEVEVEYNPEEVSLPEIINAVKKLGYNAYTS